MKTKSYLNISSICVLILFAFFNISQLLAQTMSSKIGAIETSYIFQSNFEDIDVRFQVLVNRAVEKSKSDGINNSAYGLGYNSIHLEFVTNVQLSKETVYKKRLFKNGYYKIEFFDEMGDAILEANLAELKINTLYSKTDKQLYQYSIDMIDVSLFILNQTKIINITEVVETNK